MKALSRVALGVALAGLLIVAAPAPHARADECSGLLGCVVDVVGDVIEIVVGPAAPIPLQPDPEPPTEPEPPAPAPQPSEAPVTPQQPAPGSSSGGEKIPATVEGEEPAADDEVIEVPYPDPTTHRPTPTPSMSPDFMYEADEVLPFVPESKADRQALFWWLAGGAVFFGAISLGALFAWLELRKGQRLL